MAENEENKGFDVVWDYIPHISLYQFILVLGISSLGISSGIWTLWGVFGFYRPSAYRCRSILDDYDVNLSFAEKQRLLGYHDDPQCRFYEIDEHEFSTCIETQSYFNCSMLLKSEEKISSCNSYTFDDDLVSKYGIYSAVMQYDLFCDKEIISTIIASVTFAAFFAGAALSGILSDRYGRKKVCMVSLFLSSISGNALRFMPNWWSFMILWMVTHGLNHVTYIAASVYIVEVVGPSKRHYGQLMSVGFGVGYVLTSPIAQRFPNWKNMATCSALVAILELIVVLCLPPSPRWLYVNSNKTEGWKFIEYFASKTKSSIPNEINEKLPISTNDIESSKVYTLIDILRSKYFRKIGLCMGFLFAAVTLSYYGLSFNAASLPGNLFVNNMINGAVEILAYLLLMAVMPFAGRKILTSGTFLLGGSVCIICGVMLQFADGNKNMLAAIQWMSFLGKFFISGTFGLIFVYVAELYPTSVRSIGTGFGSMCARVGGVSAPYLILLNKEGVWIPPVIFGVLTIMAGFVSLLLPETLNAPIFQTIEEAEEKNRKVNPQEMHLSDL